MKVFDVKDGVPKSLREWAVREGLAMAYRVEIDEDTLQATVYEHRLDADGKKYIAANGAVASHIRTTRVSSLP